MLAIWRYEIPRHPHVCGRNKSHSGSCTPPAPLFCDPPRPNHLFEATTGTRDLMTADRVPGKFLFTVTAGTQAGSAARAGSTVTRVPRDSRVRLTQPGELEAGSGNLRGLKARRDAD
eukprot:663113-Rhodomonas_salina.3